MMQQIAEASPRFKARITGVVYLLYFLTAVSAEVLVGRTRPIAYDAVSLIADALYIAVTLLFYYMFKPVNRSVSGLAALLSLAGCGNEVLKLFHLAHYKINSLAFFGPFCLLIGYLIFRSNFLPRILGALMGFAGLGWLIFLSPLASHFLTYLKILGFIAEASLMLWLLAMGVNIPPHARKQERGELEERRQPLMGATAFTNGHQEKTDQQHPPGAQAIV
jgi:hypothetical protein